VLDNYENGNAATFQGFLLGLAAWRDRLGLINPIIVLDNVRFHHTIEVQQLFERLGFEVKYLPPYTPYFNPIENFFSQWKQFVKQTRPQTFADIYESIIQIQNIITMEQLNNYINHCAMNCVNFIDGERVFQN
jgi:hypothetical protein